jgi:hypothetical protein
VRGRGEDQLFYSEEEEKENKMKTEKEVVGSSVHGNKSQNTAMRASNLPMKNMYGKERKKERRKEERNWKGREEETKQNECFLRQCTHLS